jgi:hypothetical protein
MSNSLKTEHTQDSQKVGIFTGEGAYTGSTKPKDRIYPEVDLDETRSTSLTEGDPFELFDAKFENYCQIKDILEVPSQQEIQEDGVTFLWALFEDAKKEAGPLTKKVLLAMEPFLEHKKRFIYIDSKIQYFKKGDVPVDNKLLHIDGSIAVRGKKAQDLGYPILHDMKARLQSKTLPPMYLAYQSSEHCATEFLTETLQVKLPTYIQSFDILNTLVLNKCPRYISQPAGSIISFNGLSLHRAVPATGDGWRLWIRCTETDREIHVDPAMASCYGSVFRAKKE